jgi:hypothetical protein
MAGSNQSSNISGMLSQIGESIGSMGSTYTDDLNRNIQNISRPIADPTDEKGMMKMANWSAKMGRTDEASMFQRQSEGLVTARDRQLAAQVKADDAAADTMFVQSVQEAQTDIVEGQAAGDTRRVEGGYRKVNQLKPTTSEHMRIINSIGGKQGEVVAKTEETRVNQTIDNINKSDQHIAQLEQQYAESGEEMPESVREGINAQKRWKEGLLRQSDVGDKWNKRLDAQLDTNGKIATAQAEQRRAAAKPIYDSYNKLMAAGKPSEALQLATKQATEQGTKEATDALQDIQVLHKQYVENVVNMTSVKDLPIAIQATEDAIASLAGRSSQEEVAGLTTQLEEIKRYENSPDLQTIGSEAQNKLKTLWAQVNAQTLSLNESDRENARIEQQQQLDIRTRIVTGSVSDDDIGDAGAVVDRALDAGRTTWDVLTGGKPWEKLDHDVQTNITRDLNLIRAGQEPQFYVWNLSNKDNPIPAVGQRVPGMNQRTALTQSREQGGVEGNTLRNGNQKSGYSAAPKPPTKTANDYLPQQ